MRVELKTEGGFAVFPGLNKPLVIDSRKLSAEDAAELSQKLEALHFFDLPVEASSPAPGAADYRQYTITVQDGQRRHTVKATEPVQNGDLQQFIAYLRDLGKPGKSQS
jgi:hypothetical protein